MESKNVPVELAEAERLRALTVEESRRTPIWAAVVGLVGIVAFSTAFGFLSDGGRTALSVGWVAFVLLWVALLRRGRRAQPASRPATSRDVAEWLIELGVSALIVVIVGRVSWALVGVLLAVLGAFGGATSALRNRKR